MVKLDSVLGLPLGFDSESSSLTFDENEIKISKIRRYKIRNLRQYVLNRELKYPVDVYLTYINVARNITKKFAIDVTIIPENLLGIEYVKSVPRKVEPRREGYRIVECAYGAVTVILQDKLENPERIILTRLVQKDRLLVPPGFFYTLINTRNSPTIIAEYYKRALTLATDLKKSKGMGYYIIAKNAKQEIVKNPNYKVIEKLQRMKFVDFNNEFAKEFKLPKGILLNVLNENEKILDLLT